jgi:hypothetical protein
MESRDVWAERGPLTHELLNTVVAISIRTSNFGWAHPNRVLSQAVFQKFAAGHPKLRAEREVRASPWGFALIASRLDAPRVPKKIPSKNNSFKKKSFLQKKTPKKLGQVGGAFGRSARLGQVGPLRIWHSVSTAPPASSQRRPSVARIRQALQALRAVIGCARTLRGISLCARTLWD